MGEGAMSMYVLWVSKDDTRQAFSSMDILSCNQERPLGFVLATEVPEIKSDQDNGSHEMSVALASFTCAYPSDIVTLRTLQRHCKLNPVSQPLVSFVYSILRLAASSRHVFMLWQSQLDGLHKRS